MGTEGIMSSTGKDACFLYVKDGFNADNQPFEIFVTDGAWDKASGRGAAAYELEVQRKVFFRFLFATLYQLLWWRLEQGCCFWNGLLVGESLIYL